MPSYDLATRGFTDFVRLQNVLDQRPISRDPLSGILDGTNRVFHASYFPVLTTGSFAVYVGGAGALLGSADYNTGEVILDEPPESQPFANYTHTPFTSTQILSFTIQGFFEMESRWTRGWQLLDGDGNWATETSGSVLVCDNNGNDPQCGSINFSTSRAQIGFLMACAEYRYLKTALLSSAIHDYMWRESVRGMTVDKSRTPANIKLAADLLLEELMASQQQAMIQAYPGGDQYGGFIANPSTADYMSNYEWQTGSIIENYRGTLGYNTGLRSLTYP